MESIEFRDMDCVMAVERERSFSRAAELTYISQPALSRIIKRVETRLGIVIFDRSSVPLEVTSEGRRVIEYFREMQKLSHELEVYVQTVSRAEGRELTIAAPSYFCSYVLPPLIESFRQEYPEYHIRLIETNDNEMKDLIRAGAADAGITVNVDIPQDTESVTLGEETIILAVPSNYSVNRGLEEYLVTGDEIRNGVLLDPSRPGVDLKVFEGEDFLFLKEGNDLYERGKNICRDAGFEPHIVMYLDQLLSAYYLAAAGKGITFSRASVPYYVGASEKVCLYKIAHRNVTRKVNFYFANGRKQETQIALFLKYLKEANIPL